MLYLALFAFLLSIATFLYVRRREKASGLPGGRLIYSDSSLWGQLAQPLSDASLGLTGKPDYLYQQGRIVIPVELKSGNPEGGPYDGHIFQLAAYCLLVERATGQRPPYGLLHYAAKPGSAQKAGGRTYAIDFTPALERRLVDLLVEMRRQERSALAERSHASPLRCQKCSYRAACDQALA